MKTIKDGNQTANQTEAATAVHCLDCNAPASPSYLTQHESGFQVGSTTTAYCLDCEAPAMDSCIKWHTTREDGVITRSEEKPAVCEPSPLPWRSAEGNGDSYVNESANSHFAIEDGNGFLIAVMIGDCVPNEAHNTCYIVKAANAYPVLLEAVKHALAVEMSTTQQQEKELREGYVELLRSAIESAEG